MTVPARIRDLPERTELLDSRIVDQHGNRTALLTQHANGSLHLCPVLDIYSWQELNAYYNLTLDVEEIGNSRSNLIEMAEQLEHAAARYQLS